MRAGRSEHCSVTPRTDGMAARDIPTLLTDGTHDAQRQSPVIRVWEDGEMSPESGDAVAAESHDNRIRRSIGTKHPRWAQCPARRARPPGPGGPSCCREISARGGPTVPRHRSSLNAASQKSSKIADGSGEVHIWLVSRIADTPDTGSVHQELPRPPSQP